MRKRDSIFGHAQNAILPHKVSYTILSKKTLTCTPRLGMEQAGNFKQINN